MSTLTQIVAGLQTRLRTITAFDQAVLDVVRRPATFPAAIIVPPAIPDYGASLAGAGADFVVPVLVVVGSAEAEKQQSLFPFVDWTGSSSVPAAIETDRTLGLTDIDAHVISTEPPGLVEFPDGTPCYGVQFNIQIFAG